jgi:hypothetical protein
VRRKTPALLGAFLLVTFTSLGFYIGFPPAVSWPRTWNRWSFDRNESRYRDLAALIRVDAVILTSGESAFYEDSSIGGKAGVRRVPRNAMGL